MKAMAAQRFLPDENGVFQLPKSHLISMRIPSEMIPHSPSGDAVTMNLCSDNTFVEDEGWHAASENYAGFLEENAGKHVLYLEIGVGANTPVIIKYPFWALTLDNAKATYACLNFHEAFCPKQIEKQSICINGDAGELIEVLR